ncbi:MAG: anti-sigma regulatory factor [Anaerolineae bacterium]
MSEVRSLPIRNDLDIVTARVEAREVAKELGFGTIDQARIATATSELARNIAQYAPGGIMTIKPLNVEGRQGIEVICEDNGPGIEDVELAMQDGYSTSEGLGKGLPGAKRLMHDFEIESVLGQGTRVTTRRWLR